MIRQFRPGAATSIALLIAVSSAIPVMAQTQSQPRSQEPTELEAISVVAPRITYKTVRERGSVLPVFQTIAEKSARVNVADLDLTRTSDLYRLEGRVNEAAARVCDELAREFPDGEPSTPVCTRRAAEDAMAQVRQISREATTADAEP